jgi:hypothetical protein
VRTTIPLAQRLNRQHEPAFVLAQSRSVSRRQCHHEGFSSQTRVGHQVHLNHRPPDSSASNRMPDGVPEAALWTAFGRATPAWATQCVLAVERIPNQGLGGVPLLTHEHERQPVEIVNSQVHHEERQGRVLKNFLIVFAERFQRCRFPPLFILSHISKVELIIRYSHSASGSEARK